MLLFFWLIRHQIVLAQCIDVDTDVLPHQPNAERVSEASDLEGLPRHCTADHVKPQ